MGIAEPGRPPVVAVQPDGSGWRYTGLDVVSLQAGESWHTELSRREAIVVPLSGGVDVDVSGAGTYELAGRPEPWGVTDVLYLPVEGAAVARASAPVRFAIAWAVAEAARPVQYLARESVPTELRGAGICSRQVNNFGVPGVVDADRLIACEVMQPGGNWSSYPPHKHDTDRDGETELEEIYYYEVDRSPAGTEGFALQRVYGSPAGDIDLTAEVRTGDVVRIPYGYHGPTVAAPGHRLYYLNVMAGPTTTRHPERAWLTSDDPDHAWIREQWKHEAVDPRLPWL